MKEDLENRERSPGEQAPVDENPIDGPEGAGGAGPGEQETREGASEERVRQLAAERDELRDMLLRKQAEFDNFRKRSERERSEFAQFASAEVMRELLSVLDSFELAVRNSESGADGERQGFLLIHKQLLDTLSRLGLEAIDAAGRPFDPNVHEAVTTQTAPQGIDDGTVLADLRTGYFLKGKLLRPSMVVVAKSGSGD